MDILIAVWSLFGWKWLLVLPLVYLAAYIGAHNPHWRILHASSNGMEKTANKLLAEAHKVAQKATGRG